MATQRGIMASKGFITVAEAATRIGVNRDVIYRLIHAKKVKSVRAGKFWYVSLASLGKYLGLETSLLLGLTKKADVS
jgi:excisionase family DNA binding protein